MVSVEAAGDAIVVRQFAARLDGFLATEAPDDRLAYKKSVVRWVGLEAKMRASRFIVAVARN
jgi:hypothetical protein